MTKSALIAFVIASLLPGPAPGATLIEQRADVPVDGFSMATLIDGVDKVLASVDDRARVVDPYDGAAAFGSGDITARQAGSATRSITAYGSADTAREPLPEPATWLMMILGFFGLSFAVRRRSIGTGDRVRFS